jgi:hypothetical protein
MKTTQYFLPIAVTAIGVTCPIIVLKVKDVMAPHLAPFNLIAVSNNSAGMGQLSEPLVMKKTKLNSHVSTTKAQWALLLADVVGTL